MPLLVPPWVEVESNYASINLSLVAGLLDSTNDAQLWGLDANTIAFTDFTWEERIYGSCFKYYPNTMRFEINLDGWLLKKVDEGTKVLNPGGDKTNPKDFMALTDKLGAPVKAWLDGNGQQLAGANVEPVELEFQIPPKKNLLLLGIPDPLF